MTIEINMPLKMLVQKAYSSGFDDGYRAAVVDIEKKKEAAKDG